jgi:acyl-coenzyme A thioesterase PaaI-like protein
MREPPQRPVATDPSIATILLERAALTEFMTTSFGEAIEDIFGKIEQLSPGHLCLRFTPSTHPLRPGGTLTGPTMMGVADVCAFALLAAHIGPVLTACTTSLMIHFLKAPKPAPLLVDAELLKLGQRNAIVQVRMRSDGSSDCVAHATVSFSLPVSRPGYADVTGYAHIK